METDIAVARADEAATKAHELAFDAVVSPMAGHHAPPSFPELVVEYFAASGGD